LADDALPVETACALPYGSLEGIIGHLKGVLKRLKKKQPLFVANQGKI